jgi:hypothetical protein
MICLLVLAPPQSQYYSWSTAPQSGPSYSVCRDQEGRCNANNKQEAPVPCLDAKFFPKFYYAKRRFPVTSKYRHMYGVLNVDEIKN